MVHLTEESYSSDTKVKEKKKTVTKNIVRESKGAGSRRIFSPVFKLQVLDSYRQDADCQGNQRATARKYGIHRRQIQKWLQMETNLRVSVQQQSSNAVTVLNLSPAGQSDAKDECSRICEEKSIFVANQNIINCSLKEKCNSDGEEFVNVDQITDSEDEETSSCSSYEETDNDKALDFTCATLSKRRFYTSDFKLHVIDAFKNDEICKGNQRATARKFGIHRRQVQKWLNQEAMIKSEHALNNTCLDLSAHKRKLDEPQLAPPNKRKSMDYQVQEAALCLVKNNKIYQPLENNNNYYNHLVYPTPSPPPLEHSFSTSSHHEYPLYECQPWSCCCHPISSGVQTGCCDSMQPKYSYSFDFKYDNNKYVHIPVQYGFGDSIPSKLIKENTLYLHEPPTVFKFAVSADESYTNFGKSDHAIYNYTGLP